MVVLGILKRNVFNIACAIVSLGSIGLGVVGFGGMSKVTDELQSVASIYGQFDSAGRKPVNDKTIAAERRRVETIQTNYKAVIERAHSLNRYEPLKPLASAEGEIFFPESTQYGPLAFRDAYRAQFDLFLKRLKAGTPPTRVEIDQMQELIDEEKHAREFQKGDEDGPGGGGPAGEDEYAEKEHASGLITATEAWKTAASRAAIQKARSLHCYATRDSFDENAKVYQGLSPQLVDMWNAQLTLWVQQDVVDSIARINNEAAEQVKSAGKRAWIGVLPIKDLISIRVSDYIENAASGSGPEVLGDNPSFPPGTPDTVFTRNGSTDLYELVQFSLKMVVDVRDLPLIIDGICKDKFHTLLNITYAYEREALETLQMEGKIYGSETVVKVVMDFETIFFGDIYRPLMPDAVLGKIGKERPGDEEEES